MLAPTGAGVVRVKHLLIVILKCKVNTDWHLAKHIITDLLFTVSANRDTNAAGRTASSLALILTILIATMTFNKLFL